MRMMITENVLEKVELSKAPHLCSFLLLFELSLEVYEIIKGASE
jgi:hypothetical protein